MPKVFVLEGFANFMNDIDQVPIIGSSNDEVAYIDENVDDVINLIS